MGEAFKLAEKNSDKSKEYGKSKYDARVSCAKLQVGDRVLVKNVKPVGKMAPHWSPDVYVVDLQRGDLPVFELRSYGSKRGKKRVLHRNLLKCVNELVPPEAQSEQLPEPVRKPKPTPRTPRPAPATSSSRNVRPTVTVPSSPSVAPSRESVRTVDTEPLCEPREIDDSASDDDDDGCFIAVYHQPAPVPTVDPDIDLPNHLVDGGEGSADEVIGSESNVDELSGSESYVDTDSTLPLLEPHLDDTISEVGSDTNDDHSTGGLDTTSDIYVTADDAPDTDEESPPDSDDASSNSSFDASSDSPPPVRPPSTVRRITRPRRPPEYLTYDRVGDPSYRRVNR